jgi:hypothetical protein
MILVDTTVWVDHLRAGDNRLAGLLEGGRVITHPFVIGEIALGHLKPRGEILRLLANLPTAIAATDGEVLEFIDTHKFDGSGIGYIDAHLLAAVKLSAGASLWTRDKRLHSMAAELGLAMAQA